MKISIAILSCCLFALIIFVSLIMLQEFIIINKVEKGQFWVKEIQYDTKLKPDNIQLWYVIDCDNGYAKIKKIYLSNEFKNLEGAIFEDVVDFSFLRWKATKLPLGDIEYTTQRGVVIDLLPHKSRLRD